MKNSGAGAELNNTRGFRLRTLLSKCKLHINPVGEVPKHLKLFIETLEESYYEIEFEGLFKLKKQRRSLLEPSTTLLRCARACACGRCWHFWS